MRRAGIAAFLGPALGSGQEGYTYYLIHISLLRKMQDPIVAIILFGFWMEMTMGIMLYGAKLTYLLDKEENAKLKEIADLIDGEWQGDGDREIRAIQALQKAGRDEIAFVARGKERPGPLRAQSRGADRGRRQPGRLPQPDPGRRSPAGVRPPAGAFSSAAAFLDGHRRQRLRLGNSPAGDDVSIGPFSYVGEHSRDRRQHARSTPA